MNTSLRLFTDLPIGLVEEFGILPLQFAFDHKLFYRADMLKGLNSQLEIFLFCSEAK